MKSVFFIAVFLLFLAAPAFADYTNLISQWAVSATASTEFSSTEWSAYQTTGETNTLDCGDIATSWAPSDSGSNPEWLKASYSTPVYATEVNIYETYNTGFVYRVDLIDESDANHTIWTGTDNTSCPGVLNISFANTTYKVKSVKIYTQINDFEEIDAVALKGYQTYVAPATSFSSLSVSPSSVKRGEQVSFSAKVDNSELSITSVTAKITQPSTSVIDSALTLSSGNATSGTYTGSWTPSNLSDSGTYKIYFYACAASGCNSSSELNFSVNPNLNINASFKSTYQQSETITITGYVTDFRGNISYAQVTGFLKPINKILNTSTSAGKYNLSYRISLDNPAGTWTAEINATDGYNNSGKTSASFTVGEPKGTEQYTLDVIEPKDNSVLKRGDKIRITAILKKGEEKITGANVAAKLPSGKQIVLEETQSGVYSKEYVVGLDEPLGAAVVGVEGIKGDLRGSTSVSATIKPAEIKIEPEIKGYKPGEEIEINAKVSYADGSSVNADVNFFIGGKKTQLAKKDGSYSGTLMVEKEGSYQIKIEAKDGFGNSGTFETSLPVYERNILDYITQNWYAIAIIFGSIFLILYKTGKIPAFERKIKLKRLVSKQKALEEKRKRIQETYFGNKAMDRKVYDKLAGETESELLKVRGELKKIRK